MVDWILRDRICGRLLTGDETDERGMVYSSTAVVSVCLASISFRSAIELCCAESEVFSGPANSRYLTGGRRDMLG